MRFLLSGLGRYLMAQSLRGILIALLAIAAAILLIDVVEQMRTVGARVEISLIEALGLTLLKAPALLEQTLPFVVLVGVMIGLIGINRRSELVALRASGVSAWRFLWPSVALGFGIGLCATMVLNPIGSSLLGRFETVQGQLLGEPPRTESRNGIWLRQDDEAGQFLIHAEAIVPNSARLLNATFYFFEVGADQVPRFSRRYQADEAELRPRFWELRQVVEGAPGEPARPQATLSIPTRIEASALYDRFVTPNTISFWRLGSYIREARAAGLVPTRYQIRQQTLLAFPLLLAAMAALGAVFSLRLQRLGGLARWGGLGLAIGFGLFFLDRLSGAFASIQATSPELAAWTPPLAGLFTALALVCFLEDG
jgi:lipopolysaccharide export system permease protein